MAGELITRVRGLGLDDQIDSGARINVLAGGVFTDQFILNRSNAGTDTVLDAEDRDCLSFYGFGSSSVADVRARMVQVRDSVAFGDRQTKFTFERVQRADVSDVMILIGS